MTSVAVDTIALVFVLACLYGAKPAKPLLRGIHPDYLSAGQGKALRGVLSIVIVFHHLGQKNMGLVLLPIFSKVGYLATSAFFFLSGYGLMTQYMHRENYSRCFLRNWYPTYWRPCSAGRYIPCWGHPGPLGIFFRDFRKGHPSWRVPGTLFAS